MSTPIDPDHFRGTLKRPFKMSTSIELGLPENITESNNIILNNNITAVSFFKFALSPYHTRKVHYLDFRVIYMRWRQLYITVTNTKKKGIPSSKKVLNSSRNRSVFVGPKGGPSLKNLENGVFCFCIRG